MLREKSSLSKFAEEVARDRIGEEISKRFRILEQAASDPELVRMIETFDPAQVREQLTEHELQKWIKNLGREHVYSAPADSWFINDQQGRQIARDPLLEEDGTIVNSFMGDYAFRDYFHGEGQDRPKSDTNAIHPIVAPNICAVYVSSNSGKLKVAFSVPIFSTDEQAEQAKVVGVLSTSFDLGAFEVSGLSHLGEKQIVLVDLRDDYLEGTARRGLILNHELQNNWKQEAPPRVASEVLDAVQNETGHFVAGYRDPFASDHRTTHWGVCELVNYRTKDVVTGQETVQPSGWMVLVQTEAMR